MHSSRCIEPHDTLLVSATFVAMTIKYHCLLTCLLCVTVRRSFVVKKQLAFRPTTARQVSSTRQDTLQDNGLEESLAERCGIPRSALPPPPKSTENPDDDFFRAFRDQMPASFQSWMRDSGLLRFIADSLVYAGLPSLVQQYPDALFTFLQMSSQCETIPYGNHPRQKMDVFTPKHETSKGLVLVCHGGAWGSGEKWMYRLMATKKLECGYTVAVLGYRTYPDATVDGQVSDVSNALAKLRQRYPSLHTTVIGHSSGAHISLLGALQEKLNVDGLICLAGVYDVVNHYVFETGRGLERISPLQPANGHAEEEWALRSPTRLVDKTTSSNLPPTLLIHGVEDTVVPYTSALEFHEALQECQAHNNCTLSLLPSIEHAETVLQLMVGGKTQDVVVDWLERQLQQAS